MKKRVTWATIFFMFVLIISLSVNLIAGATWQCFLECNNECDPRCTGEDCFTIYECCGYCKEGGEINCICCSECNIEP